MNVPTKIHEFLYWLGDLSESDIGRYASGAYGPDNRMAFCKMIKSFSAKRGDT